jgi:hypothetical protein
MNYSIKAKSDILLFDYLKIEGITDGTVIKTILLENKFRLANPYQDSNNYMQFVDEEGYLTFNNPDMQITGYSAVRSGCIDHENGSVGNSLKFNNIFLCNFSQTKEDIIATLIELEKKTKELEIQKKELNDKLGYLLIVNTNILLEKDYAEFNKNQVTEKLLNKPTTAIATIKN